MPVLLPFLAAPRAMPGQQRMRVSKQGRGDTAGKLAAMMQASGEICRKNGVRMKQFGVFIAFWLGRWEGEVWVLQVGAKHKG